MHALPRRCARPSPGRDLIRCAVVAVTVSIAMWLPCPTSSKSFASANRLLLGRRELLRAAGLSIDLLSTAPRDGEAVSRYASIEMDMAALSRMNYNFEHCRMFHTFSGRHCDPSALLASNSAALFNDLPAQGIVCVGEEHNHPLHHAAEVQILQSLREQTPQRTHLALGLEMFGQTNQHRSALNDFVFGKDTLDDLQRRTNWDNTWGWPMVNYAKLLTYAKDSRIEIVPLNCPVAISRSVRLMGAGGFTRLPDFPTTDLSNEAHRLHFVETYFGSKADKVPERLKQRVYETQTIREEFMAAAASRHLQDKGGRLMVVTGRSHIEGRFGVPDRIQRRFNEHGIDCSPTTLLMQSADWHETDHNGVSPDVRTFPGTDVADWVWYTERVKESPAVPA